MLDHMICISLIISGSVVKNLPPNAGDTGYMGAIPGLGRFPGGGNGNLLQPGKFHGQRNLAGGRVTKSWA